MPTLGAIDIGSNAIRLIIVELTSAGRLVKQEVQRYRLRLGTDVFEHGVIGAASGKELRHVFTDMAKRLESHGVEQYRAVATAAMREASNAEFVLDHLRDASGIAVEIIDGAEESALARQALLRAVGCLPKDALLIDLGGGSLEIGRARKSARLSLPLGTVRLCAQHSQFRSPMNDDELHSVMDAVAGTLQRSIRQPHRTEVAVGTGGNLQSLAALFPAELQFPAIDMAELYSSAPFIAAQTIEQRAHSYGLRMDRAELFLPAAVILLALSKVFGFRVLLAPGTGLREQLLHQQALPAGVHAEALAQLKRLGRPVRRAVRIARMAERLFAALGPLHGLWALATRPLLIAAYLRDAGRVIDDAGVVAHSAYLARACGSRLIDDHVGAMSAGIVCASFGQRVTEFSLQQEDRGAAEQLGAILDLAHVLDGCGAREFHSAHLTKSPAVIDCGLDRPMTQEKRMRFEHALGCQFIIK